VSGGGDRENTEFCTAAGELRVTVSLPTGLSAYRPHPEVQLSVEVSYSEDLNFGLSILTLSQNTGMQFLWAGLSAFRHILIVYFPVAGKEAMGIMSLRMYVGL
jgi:hypothetical protein